MSKFAAWDLEDFIVMEYWRLRLTFPGLAKCGHLGLCPPVKVQKPSRITKAEF